MAIQRAFALLTVSATQRHPAYSHVPQRLARPWHFSKTIKNRLKWEKMISHFKRLRFSNFAAGYKRFKRNARPCDKRYNFFVGFKKLLRLAILFLLLCRYGCR